LTQLGPDVSVFWLPLIPLADSAPFGAVLLLLSVTQPAQQLV